VLVLLFGAAAANAQEYAQGPGAPAFTQQELDQILAPIALYPDALLSQIMMAATYPREVTEAADWSRANRDLNGDRAVRAVERYDWDPSVKSLVAFPQILDMMNQKINWTEDLGDAFLDQQPQVMDTIQYLRRQAYAAGNLQSSDQFRVDVRDSSFVIDFVNPEIAYLPYYNPVVVYGTWWWPTHQPVYWAPWPGYYTRVGFRGYAWGPPIRVSSGFFYSAPDWRQRRVNIVNVNNYYYRSPQSYRADAPRNAGADAPHVWQHDVAHRRDVPRRDAGWRQPAARVETAPRVEATPEARPAPSQPIAASPAPNAPRSEPQGRGVEPRGNDTRGSEQRSERMQRRDPRFDSNRAMDRTNQQPQQPTVAAPVARAPVAATTPPVAVSAMPAANQPRVAPLPMPVPTPPPVAGGRPNVEARPVVANAPRAPEGPGRRAEARQTGSHEHGVRQAVNDSTVAAAPSGNPQSPQGTGTSRGNGGRQRE
jgi:hypothetical protein